MLFAQCGMYFLAAGTDLITLFIGLELMALCFYVMVGFLRTDRRSNEAALKYLILGAFSSGFLVYGFSVMYGMAGSTKLSYITRAIQQRPPWDPMVFLALTTTSVGLLFKISAVPFHMWAPDAYEGAPTTVTAYLSVASKAASIAFLLRIFLGPLASARDVWEPLLSVIAVLTLTVGNLAAINQTNIKRLLAYSSISHAGYMLLGLIAGNDTGINGIAVYIMVYTFMNLGALLVVVAMRRANIIGEDVDDMAGLVHKNPGYAFLMLIFLLSLAGIPPTAGFLGKYYIFLSLIQTRHYALAVFATLYVAVAIYYYFKIVRSMFSRRGGRTGSGACRQLRPALRAGTKRRGDPGHRALPRAVPETRADFAVPVNAYADGHQPSAVHAHPGDAGHHRGVPAGRRLYRAGGAQGAGGFPGAPRPHARGPARAAAADRRRIEAAAEGRHYPGGVG